MTRPASGQMWPRGGDSGAPIRSRVVFHFNAGTSALSAGEKITLPNMPAGTITGWHITAPDEAGTISFGLKIGANLAGLASVTGGNNPAISSSGQEASDTTLTSWTTATTEGHLWEAEVLAAATITNATLVVALQRS